MAHLTAQSVLEMRFISYATPLELARRWSRTGDWHEPEQALALLKGLFKRFPHSIEIGQELALAYIEARDDGAARLVLDDIQLLCRNPNEEVLARCGRVYRDKGDSFVTYHDFPGPPAVKIGGRTEVPAEALRHYHLALQEYAKAFEIRHGHYPGVNVATLHLLIAAFESNDVARVSNLETSKKTAEGLLARKSEWPLEFPDDPIWHAASAGELHLLLGDWPAAHDCYRAALKHGNCHEFHRGSMLKQVLRIVYCHRRLGVASLGAFDDLSQVFAPPATKTP